MLLSPISNVIQTRKLVCHVLITLILLSFVVGFTGCSVTDVDDAEDTPVIVSADAPSTIRVSTSFGLDLTTDRTEYKSADTRITYSLENMTDVPYCFSQSTISIEVLENGEWYSLAFRTDKGDMVFTAEGSIIPPHHTFTGVEGFSFYGDYVPAGTYRLVIGVRAEDISTSTPEYLVAEFIVTT